MAFRPEDFPGPYKLAAPHSICFPVVSDSQLEMIIEGKRHLSAHLKLQARRSIVPGTEGPSGTWQCCKKHLSCCREGRWGTTC